MIIDLSLQQYVDWEVKPVIPIKGKFGYRVVLKYIDGTERTQQKSGFRTEKESNAARDNTIGKLHAGTYIVYENVKVSDFLEFWIKEDICKRVRSEETYAAYSNIVSLERKRCRPLTVEMFKSCITTGQNILYRSQGWLKR